MHSKAGDKSRERHSLRGMRWKGKGKGEFGRAREKGRNVCKDAIVFSIFHAQILSVKIVIGQN